VSVQLAIPPRTAALVAYLAAATNLAAAIAMLLLLRPGLPALSGTVDQHIAYIAGHLTLWRLGWLLWNAAAVSLLAFYTGLAGVFVSRAPLICALALVVATAGIAADLSAEALYMGVGADLGPGPFAALEHAASLLTGYVGNGLYTLAGVLLVWAGAREIPRPLLLLSLPVWAAGLALSGSSLVGFIPGQIWSTAALMPLFVIWTGLMGRWLASRGS